MFHELYFPTQQSFGSWLYTLDVNGQVHSTVYDPVDMFYYSHIGLERGYLGSDMCTHDYSSTQIEK